MKASTRSRKSLVFSEISKTTTSPSHNSRRADSGTASYVSQSGRGPWAINLVVVMEREAPRKSLPLATKKGGGGGVQDITQVLVAAVQVGLSSIGTLGSKGSGFGPALPHSRSRHTRASTPEGQTLKPESFCIKARRRRARRRLAGRRP